ncbi:hypothetical protein HOD41_05970, partial [bacterium]|nr:hypothetical protein [bacterium]
MSEWNNFLTLLDPGDKDYLPPEAIPVVPDVKRKVAVAGDLTWDIDPKIRFGDGQRVVPFQREAEVGEDLRDVEMRFVPDFADNIEFRMKVRNACEGNKTAQEYQKLLCKNSIVYYCNTWCWTFHPGKQAQPFIAFEIQKEILCFFAWLVKLRLTGLIEKSREGGVSWLMCIASDWLCRFFPQYWALHLSVTEEEVDNRSVKSLMGKVRFLLKNNPEWLRMGWVEKAPGIDTKMNMQFPETESVIQGELTGGQAGIGGRANVALYDEFARVIGASDTLEASSSLAFAKVLVSTVKGMGNAFARIAHDPATNKIRFHWSDHFYKDEKWSIRERAKTEYTDEIWAQEQDISYVASTAGRVYQRFLTYPNKDTGWCHIGKGQEFEKYSDWETGILVDVMMDYGISKSNPNVALFAQIKQALPDYMKYTDECLCIFDEMVSGDQSTEEMVQYFKDLLYIYGRFIGDLYTGTQRDRILKEKMTIQKYMTSQGMNLVGHRHGDKWPILEVKKLLERPGALIIHPRCVTLVQSLQNWGYPVDKETKKP